LGRKRFSVGKIKKSDYLPVGKYPIIDQGEEKIAGYWNKESDVFENELPVIIFGDHTRRFKFVDQKFVRGADGTKILKPKKIFDPKFFFYAAQNLDVPNKGYNRHYKYLRELKIPVPPKIEQQKIASILTTVQDAIEQTEAVIQATRELKKSMMKHLFTYGPVPVGQTDQVELKETEIGEIPEEWKIHKLDKFCSFTTGKLNANEAKENGKYPFFTCAQETYKIDKYAFDCQAILLAGNNANGIYSVKHYKGKFNAYQRTYVISIMEEENLEYEYLKYALETRLNFLQTVSIGTSTKFLTAKIINQLKLPIPSKSTQIEIIKILNTIDVKIQSLENEKLHLENTFESLLENLMTAKVRVV
jgi:type I restriction enzyme S subunit